MPGAWIAERLRMGYVSNIGRACQRLRVDCGNGQPKKGQKKALHICKDPFASAYVYIGKGMALVLPEDRIPRDQIDEFIAEIEERKTTANNNLVRTA